MAKIRHSLKAVVLAAAVVAVAGVWGAPNNEAAGASSLASHADAARLPARALNATHPGAVDPTFRQTLAGLSQDADAVAVQPDGKVILGGLFGTPTRGLLRLNRDGTLDATFRSAVNWTVDALAVQADGKIVVHDPNRGLVRLNTGGRRDTTFTAAREVPSQIYSIVIQPDGRILLGGPSDADGTALVRLNPDGSRDRNFTVGLVHRTLEAVDSVALTSAGRILVGGYFRKYNGVRANGLIRLNADGSRDNTLVTGTGFTDDVYSVATTPAGKILVNSFGKYNENPITNAVIQLNPDGSRDTTFEADLPTTTKVQATAVQPDGRIVVGAWDDEASVLRLNPDGTRDTSLTATVFNDFVQEIVLDADGEILVSGLFTSPSAHLAWLHRDGGIDTTFRRDVGTGLNAPADTVALQPDGKILVGGGFTRYNGIPAPLIARLNSDGSRDTTFNQTGSGLSIYQRRTGEMASREVLAIAVQPDGKILVGGSFISYNGTPANALIRLNHDGSRDLTFRTGRGFTSPNDATVSQVVQQPDGKILVVGYFRSYNGKPASNFVRLNQDGSRDANFRPVGVPAGSRVVVQPDGKILTNAAFGSMVRLLPNGRPDRSFQRLDDPYWGSPLALQPDGKIIVSGGGFSFRGPSLFRQNANGTLDRSFSTGSVPDFDDAVSSVAVMRGGRIVAAGGFHWYRNGRIHEPSVIRLLSDGRYDRSFTASGTGLNGGVYDMEMQPDGKLVVAGDFSSYNGRNYASITRLIGGGRPPRAVPGAPRHVRVKAAKRAVKVKWRKPARTGGQPITRYRAVTKTGAKSCTTRTATHCKIKSLRAGKTYRIKVRARTAAGWGPWSPLSRRVTTRK